MRPDERLIVALDTGSAKEALALVERLGERACFYKVGMGLFAATGPAIVADLRRRGKKIVLDLKFHDSPMQVALSCRAVTRLGVALTNLHALAGREAMAEAARAVAEESAASGVERPLLVAVTVLTSHAGAEVSETVLRLARDACESGLDGIVCSGEEVKAVKAALGPRCLTVVPGIRPAGADVGDQRRIYTPGQAIRDGADYLVVGRPITGAPNPAEALRHILEEMDRALHA